VSQPPLLDRGEGAFPSGQDVAVQPQEFAASLLLCELALRTGLFVVGRDELLRCRSITIAQVYTMPLTKPRKMAVTLPNVMGALKKIRPLTAIGNLLRAPTIEYVVDEVTRMHQAEQYEMKTAASPEYTMPITKLFRVSSGKFLLRFSDDQSSRSTEHTTRIGMLRRLL
jgi:hypothetical protein